VSETVKTITVISKSSPGGNDRAQTLMELVLALGVFEQNLNLIFYADGVYQLLDDQDSALLDRKNHAGSIQALDLYGIDKVFIDSDSLHTRGLTEEQLTLPATLISPKEISALLAKASIVINL